MQPAAIGPFKIERELGRGGMGEVYLANDARLDRLVAIKALPAHLAQDPDRLARFQREAKVLASLNHPNIGAIYGLEEANENQYLILEFVEGETLADRLSKGPISLEESLGLAKQMTEALEAAHEKGIIHRDFKPGNVMVTSEGVVKVLDFGLARTADGAPSTTTAPSPMDSPTLTSPARFAHSPTIPGVIMGTAGYMSPEQARGKPVDKRSDIFSFGCVLYEMLTGAQPFRGETVADAIGATLHKESDLNLLPPNTPRRVRNLLANCLAKDKKHRLHDIGDARIELERAINEPREPAQGPAAIRPWWQSAGVLVAASLIAIAVPTTAFVLRTSSKHPQSQGAVVRAGLPLPKGMSLLQSDRSFALSPDGNLVALSLFPKDGSAPPSLYVRDLSRLEYRSLAGTQEATYPFWSPDGKSIAFFADRKLKRVDLADGIVRVLCDAPAGRGGSWGSKGTIVFAPSAGGGLLIVRDAGGTPTAITTTATLGESHRVPHFLPDGERFLYYINNTNQEGVYAFDPTTKQSRLVLSGWAEATYVEPGMLIFAQDENLMAQPFDLRRLELTGSARPIAADVNYSKIRVNISAGISKNGTLIYQLARPPEQYSLAWMDRKGQRTPLGVEPTTLRSMARVSNDGRRAAVECAGTREEVSTVVIDLERGVRTVASNPEVTFSWGVLWAPRDDGIFTTEAIEGVQSIVKLSASGGAGVRVLQGESGFEYFASSITNDAKTLIYTKTPLTDKKGDIMTLNLESQEPPRPFMQTPEPEWGPLLSPGEDVLAYLIADEEQFRGGILKVCSYPTPSTSVQVSATPFGGHCSWLSESELAWSDRSRRMWSATIAVKDGEIDVGVPKPMFDGKPLDKQTFLLDYDIARERFLIAVEVEPREDPQLIIVSDWRQ